MLNEVAVLQLTGQLRNLAPSSELGLIDSLVCNCCVCQKPFKLKCLIMIDGDSSFYGDMREWIDLICDDCV